MEFPVDTVTSPVLLDKFRSQIGSLWGANPRFKELWADYLEIVGEIQKPGLDKAAVLELGRLRASLEAEIFESLCQSDLSFKNISNNP